jgi:CubicO group peptidase (beta-lactamase class C family)
MKTLTLAGVVAIVLTGLAPIGAQAPAPVANGGFDIITALAEAKMHEFNVPGVAIGIIDNGHVTTRIGCRSPSTRCSRSRPSRRRLRPR